jgi:hypothetical protein
MRSVTPATVALVYADLQSEIEEVVAHHTRRYGGDRDEHRADANYYFLIAYHSFDPARGDLASRVRYVIWQGLAGQARSRLRRPSPCRVDLDEAFEPPARPEPERFNLGRYSARVGPDGRRLLELLFDAPPEFDSAVREDNRPSHLRKCLWAHALREWGWDETRFKTALRRLEI